MERALAMGTQGYLVKPTAVDELAAEVLRLFAESRKTQTVTARAN